MNTLSSESLYTDGVEEVRKCKCKQQIHGDYIYRIYIDIIDRTPPSLEYQAVHIFFNASCMIQALG